MNLKLEKPLVFFDLETTGLDLQKDRIVQMALIKIFPDGKIEKGTRMLNPEMPISPDASKVHGITDEMVKDKKTFNQIAQGIFQYLSGCDIAGYNIKKFDLTILFNEFKRAGIEFDVYNHQYIDVLEFETVLNPRDLSTVYKKYTGEEMTNAHDAFADTEATLKILEKQLQGENTVGNSINEINNFIKDKYGSVDISGKLKMANGEICWAFGKHFNKPIKDDIDYCRWIMNTDFPIDTKKIVGAFLDHYEKSLENN